MSRRSQRGVVMLGVLFFVLLAASGVATFLRAATLDGLAVRNRDAAARCEALAGGGVQIATALIVHDRLDEQQANLRVDSAGDRWAERPIKMVGPGGDDLELRIEDAGARLDLNALMVGGAPRDALTEPYLVELLRKAIDEIPLPAEQKSWDPAELAAHLIDYLDADDVTASGGREDDPYQKRDPPTRAANRPLLSIDELARVEGFDPPVVDALRPYVGVWPLAQADGINPNTAPPWVLGMLFHGVAGDYRLAQPDEVRQILDIRERGGILCADEAEHPSCTPIRDAIPDSIFPPPTFSTEVFRVTAAARCGGLERTVEAIIDRSEPADPRLLAWTVR